MATRIRLARAGAKKRPFYRIVVADSRSSRDGKFIEKLGTYNPLLEDNNENKVVMKRERIEYWLGVGALPSERVEKLIQKQGITVANKTAKAAPKAAAAAAPKAPKKAKA